MSDRKIVASYLNGIGIGLLIGAFLANQFGGLAEISLTAVGVALMAVGYLIEQRGETSATISNSDQ